MKKKVFMFLTVLLLVVMAGCGAEKGSDTPETAGETNQSAENSAEADTKETEELSARETAEALSVENDQFTFDALVNQIDETEESFLSLLGVETAAETYTAELFGTSASIKTSSEEGKIQTIDLTFADTNADSLFIAISEQLGQDGQDTEDTVKWVYEDTNITLSQDGNTCVVEISK